MIPNCQGCEIDLYELENFVEQGLYFAGKGLYEEGHLILLMLDNNGKIIVE